jgi:hypothetical protein
MEYKIIQGFSGELEKQVTELLRRGFGLYGDLIFVNINNDDGPMFAQVMIRE